MYPRNRSGSPGQSGIDGESLQADVMRFMAIIGFCLVAIMALVRDVTPPVGAAQPAPVEPVVTPAKPAPERADRNLVLADAAPPVAPQQQPQVQAKFLKVQPDRTAERFEESVVAEVREPVVVTDVEQQVAKRDPAEPQVESEPKPDQGLSLRFHSDRDFLRLITSGEVVLYLFNDQVAFKLAKNYRLTQTQAPRQLYEVMPQTIPAAITASAQMAVPDSTNYKWGVVMPARIEQRIASLVATESSGQLVIDRFGAVRHETPLLRDQSRTADAGMRGQGS